MPSWNPLTAPKKNTTPLLKKRKISASAKKNAPVIDTIANNFTPADQAELIATSKARVLLEQANEAKVEKEFAITMDDGFKDGKSFGLYIFSKVLASINILLYIN